MDNSKYPAWMQRWNEKAEEIDARIIAFFKRAGAEIEELYEDVRRQFHQWALDAAENTEQYEREHKSTAELRERVDRRVEELTREGRIEARKEAAAQETKLEEKGDHLNRQGDWPASH